MFIGGVKRGLWESGMKRVSIMKRGCESTVMGIV